MMSTGQTESQTPQSTQIFLPILWLSPFSLMAITGHTSAQAPQLM
jgi:hypothetical protein